MKILLSVYACEPGKGSEPGVGWRWACGLVGRVNLTVLTRISNRGAIENTIQQLPAEDPLRGIRFLYHDLSAPFLWAKRHGLLPTMAYYILWQKSASKRFADIAEEMDVVHHLTFCTLLCPGFWKLNRAKFVLGPVGAPQVNSHYLPLFGNRAWLQRVRGWIMERFLNISWLRHLLARAMAVVPANSETRALLISQGVPARDIMLDTGAPELMDPVNYNGKTGFLRLIYAGQLERRKGIELALRALAAIDTTEGCDWRFTILGDGPDRNRLTRLAKKLGIHRRVIFHGAVLRLEVSRHLAEADAFLFTSVRDTSGGVNLEAMAQGLPIICIAHQGVGDITDESCAERIPAGPIDETIHGLANAIIRLAGSPARRQAMGQSAKLRAHAKFTWEEKFERMLRIYGEGK